MKLILFIFLPLFLSAQTVDDNIDSIVKRALDEKLIPLNDLVDVLDSLIVVKVDSIVRVVHEAEEWTYPINPVKEGFKWVDVQGNVLGLVGGPITLPGHVSIHTYGVDGPVTFKLSGPINITKEEGASPYALFGDIGVRPIVRLFPKGNYELTADYKGGTLNASFKVE